MTHRFLNYSMKLKYGGIRKLIDKFELDEQERGKGPVYVQDLTELNETIFRTQEKRFNFGYEHIQMCLFSMLGIFTVNRLSALLSLQLKHLQFSIQKDPQGGPPVLLAEVGQTIYRNCGTHL
ncbi:hypothetical protein N7532_008525 [Penicillium argentinense]|uniref:Uncharacterized protein n=1 Tax=Penicillium argentinense TaxID=1131581 RepID=A0A9W9EXS2_9EURO|nr:uncharacterized protein N7532_008525 [Penicillium argentinense]KAJ5089841.1 hypothetical protein N7532_008525 [Penicillium argentinense]